jgi:hypothetical protein
LSAAQERSKRKREMIVADSVRHNTFNTAANGGALEGSRLSKVYHDHNYFELIESSDTEMAHRVVDATFYDLVEQDVINLLESESTSAMNTLTWFTTKRSIDNLNSNECLIIDFEHLYINIFDRVCSRYDVRAPLIELVSVGEEEDSTPKMPRKVAKSDKMRNDESTKVRSIHRGTTMVRTCNLNMLNL